MLPIFTSILRCTSPEVKRHRNQENKTVLITRLSEMKNRQIKIMYDCVHRFPKVNVTDNIYQAPRENISYISLYWSETLATSGYSLASSHKYMKGLRKLTSAAKKITLAYR